MKFFPGYVNDARRQALDTAAYQWNLTGQQQKKLMKWGDRGQVQGGMLMLEAPTPPSVAQKGRQAQPQALPSGANVSRQHPDGTQGTEVAALTPGQKDGCSCQ